MEKIKEVIVVEGKNDSLNLKRYFDVETIETHGLGLDDECIERIREVAKHRDVILFLDPDHPGEKIRNRINQAIPGLKNAFVLKEDARTSKKVGIEHADKEVLKEALNHLISYEEKENTLTRQDFYDLGLDGQSDSAARREILIREYRTGKCNAKTLLKRLNLLGITKEEIKKQLS